MGHTMDTQRTSRHLRELAEDYVARHLATRQIPLADTQGRIQYESVLKDRSGKEHVFRDDYSDRGLGPALRAAIQYVIENAGQFFDITTLHNARMLDAREPQPVDSLTISGDQLDELRRLVQQYLAADAANDMAFVIIHSGLLVERLSFLLRISSD